jgi:hypothetical protein
MGRGNDAPASKENGVITMTKQSIDLSTASLTGNEAAAFLPLAAQTAITGKASIDAGKAKGASALAVMVAGFASDEVAERKWSFDIDGKAGEVHTLVRCTGLSEFGNDDLEWKRNSQGAISKVAQSAYKSGLQHIFFSLPSPIPAVWTMASKAALISRAIREEGMIATIDNGELKLTGGTTERAKAMEEAKSLSALAKVANGATGSNRAAPNNEAATDEGRVATAFEISRDAVALVKLIAKGETDEGQAVLGNLREIARLIASNPDAFADD